MYQAVMKIIRRLHKRFLRRQRGPSRKRQPTGVERNYSDFSDVEDQFYRIKRRQAISPIGRRYQAPSNEDPGWDNVTRAYEEDR